jgi:hypothetical protein
VTRQTNLLQDADAADKIAVSPKSKILGYVTARYLTKLYPVKAVNSYVILVRGGISRQVCYLSFIQTITKIHRNNNTVCAYIPCSSSTSG